MDVLLMVEKHGYNAISTDGEEREKCNLLSVWKHALLAGLGKVYITTSLCRTCVIRAFLLMLSLVSSLGWRYCMCLHNLRILVDSRAYIWC